ncbi:histone-lysine N-methyltransferase SETDB2 [Sceloporus undulatus]|uniref:histone-lysine N-methyltransferase SETDB2 n=1 Tax=Sceloporus undulatus TaxID=8520 RepID=UPI001C4D06E5|nr:histone-lysine N-methyltransferase SETDB2 [Sceloporus undulatus]
MEEAMDVDANVFWHHLEDSTVDLIFERLQSVLLSLKQKIKDGTATEEECCQALTFMKQVDMTDLLPLINVNVASEEGIPTYKLDLHPSASSEENPGNVFSLRMEPKEAMHSRSQGTLKEISSKVTYQDHICSKECLAKRPWNSYKGENPLHLPLLCHFQRQHAKADAVLKSHDVIYKGPCGKSLRNFQDVQNYLFQTECTFLFLDHFSFNTYVQVFRKSPSCHIFEFDYDISKGAEAVPVSFCNDIDHSRLPYFKYRKASWPHGYFLNNFSSTFLDSCSCTDGCTDRTKCACLLLTERRYREGSDSSGKEISAGYSYKRLDNPVPSGIYECSLLCSCDKILCQNRLVQHGLQVRLQVFNAEKKGWGVRCLDDIDKGTFVCTYSGRLMSRDQSRQVKDGSGNEVKEEDAENSNRSYNLISRKRNIVTVCSDSETEFIQTAGKQNNLHLKPGDQPNTIQNYSCKKSWHNKAIKRPKTRTSILQSHGRQLGIADASSDEDESSVCQKSTRRRVTAAAQKECEKLTLEGEVGEQVNPVQPEVNTNHCDDKQHKHLVWTDNTCKEKCGRRARGSMHSKEAVEDKESCLKEPIQPKINKDHSIEDPLSIASLDNKPPVQDDKQCNHSVWIDNTCKENLERGVQESVHNKEAMEDYESYKEGPCLLDATREGNVGRFLNHSCSPNLFVQSVFVETHNRNFPWVAFFTNRHVKAGTELTWDYGYEAGSMPETETTCYCGVQKCRKKIL